MILQERVGTAAVERDRAAHGAERIRLREQHEREEEEQDAELDERRPRNQSIIGTGAEPPSRRAHIYREGQEPQEDRALERGPRGREGIEAGRRPGDVVGHVLDREVVSEQRGLHDGERADRGGKHDGDVAPAELKQSRPLPVETERRRDETEQRRGRTDGEQGVTEVGPHLPNGSGGHLTVPWLGGLYSLPCLINKRLDVKVAPSQWPSATTGAQSLNMPGSSPLCTTPTVTCPCVSSNVAPLDV